MLEGRSARAVPVGPPEFFLEKEHHDFENAECAARCRGGPVARDADTEPRLRRLIFRVQHLCSAKTRSAVDSAV